MMSADRTDDPDPITRQLNEYWAAWGRAMNESLGRSSSAGDAFSGGFQAGGPWMGAIHQLARRALEEGLDSAGMAAAWRQILRGNGLWPDWKTPDGPNADILQTLFAPWLKGPTFGPAREHLSRWQDLLRQQLEVLAEGGTVGQLLDAMMEAAIAGFEQRLRQCEGQGSPLHSARALFDLWIEAAEQAWETMASSEAFAQASAQTSQAQLKLQQAAQFELGRFCQAVGLPTRAEMDQAQQRIVALERELARLRGMIAPAPAPAPAAASRSRSNPRVARKSAAKPAATRSASKTSPTAPAAARKVASKTVLKKAAKAAPKTSHKKAGA